MKKIVLTVICVLFSLSVFSHPWKPSHYVIVDTDGGIDDIRALTMLLASPDVRVLAITISPGALGTESAYRKVRSLLNSFYHEGVPVGINRRCSFKSPEFQVALNTVWGDEKNISAASAPDGIDLIKDVLSQEKTKISFICLGGLTTAELAADELPEFKQQVKEIIWSSDGPAEIKAFNYQVDASAAMRVLSGTIPVKSVKGLPGKTFFDEKMLNTLASVQTVYAEKITGFFRSENVKNHEFAYSLTDEMTAIYLHFPGIFQHDSINGIYECPASNDVQLRENMLKILSGETVSKNQVISMFPTDPSFYSSDVEPFVSDIIKKYGMDEWVSAVITNELHRHLGALSIIGVKMGIRAREYFDTGVDEFSTTSYAGSDPPLSCVNDGLQVSTGSTPGHGLLTVINDSPSSPSAVFTYMNHKIRLTLKPDIAGKILADLKEINFVYGLDSNIYWELVRKNSLKYWRDLDRHVVFDIEVIK
jgi:pyrimidine-specific ribonucleoside hydrolase